MFFLLCCLGLLPVFLACNISSCLWSGQINQIRLFGVVAFVIRLTFESCVLPVQRSPYSIRSVVFVTFALGFLLAGSFGVVCVHYPFYCPLLAHFLDLVPSVLAQA